MIVKDLVVLTADSQTEHAIRGMITRHKSLKIRSINCTFLVHPLRDPGCLREGHKLLHSICNQYDYALMIFDHEGCGRENIAADALEAEVLEHLANSGWRDRCAVIILRPELEIWVWSDSPKVDHILGWGSHVPPLRQWLKDQGFQNENEPKPNNPKDALLAALRVVKKPVSASLFKQLAESVSLDRCIDSSFVKLKTTLIAWFGTEDQR